MAKSDVSELPVPQGWEDDYKLAFPSDYLGHQHLRGKEPTLTITAVRLPELKMVKPGMRPQVKRKLVVEFGALKGRTDGTPHLWIVNKTNAETIVGLYGKKPRDWVGKAITLYTDDHVQLGRETVSAIRVRARIPPSAQQRPARESPATRPPAGDAPAAAGPPDEEEMQEIARREAEEDGG